jgi:hypothetical protein
VVLTPLEGPDGDTLGGWSTELRVSALSECWTSGPHHDPSTFGNPTPPGDESRPMQRGGRPFVDPGTIAGVCRKLEQRYIRMEASPAYVSRSMVRLSGPHEGDMRDGGSLGGSCR